LGHNLCSSKGYNNVAGNYIEVDHGGGYKTRYLHLRQDSDGGPVYTHSFSYYGYSVENSGNCSSAPNDPSPYWASSPPQVRNLLLDRSFDEGTTCDQSNCVWHRFHPPGGTTNWSLLSCCPSPNNGTKFLRFSSTVAGRQRTFVDPPADERAHASIWES
jgi:hypothetical protein